MSIAIDLVLFEPARHVAYGMPVFTGTDASLLRYLLMNHGEWGDNTTTWHASYSADGPHMQLLCSLHTDEGTVYRERFASQLAQIEQAWAQEGEEIRFKLPSFWHAYRRSPAERVTATRDGPMSRQQGCWFPCDGAIALDASQLPPSCRLRLPELFDALVLDQPDLMTQWRARAEYCFLLQLQPPNEGRFASIDIRETPFRNRQASLVEMRLPISETLLERITA